MVNYAACDFFATRLPILSLDNLQMCDKEVIEV